jgi:D-threo-aldose 1-dehydrogenase
MIPKFLQRWPINFFLVAMPYTLLEQEGLEELESAPPRRLDRDRCALSLGYPGAVSRSRRDLSLCPGRTGDREQGGTHRASVSASSGAACRGCLAVPARARKRCVGHSGPVKAEEVRQNLAWLSQPIPAALWAELKAERLIRAEAPTPA